MGLSVSLDISYFYSTSCYVDSRIAYLYKINNKVGKIFCENLILEIPEKFSKQIQFHRKNVFSGITDNQFLANYLFVRTCCSELLLQIRSFRK